MLERVFAFGSMLLVLLIISVLPAAAQGLLEANFPPEVSNVNAEQVPGTKLVRITYDVDDPEDDILTISVAVSNNGGTTFIVPARTFLPGSDVWRGDDGSGIPPGTSKEIVWNAGADTPDTFGANFRVKVTASDAGMVLIPAGPFRMGDTFSEGNSDERPVHDVLLSDFYIDVYEVTNAQYAEFNTAHTYPVGKEDHPVLNVTWVDAAAYAHWAGKRLPTEAEWEKAARGGLVGKRYPWGNSITEADANYNKASSTPVTTPVGNYPPNGYGLYDVAGNVWEWCADWYDANYYSVSPGSNPQGPVSGTSRVLRGGSWGDIANNLRVATRASGNPSSTFHVIGFRCAGNVVVP